MTKPTSPDYESLQEPLSPLDPVGTAPDPRPVSGASEIDNGGQEFFDALYLRTSEDSQGPTQPLKVRKVRKGSVPRDHIATVGGRQRRRSTVSVPRSPRSPRDSHGSRNYPISPRCSLTRTNTSSTTQSRIHATISHLFLLSDPFSPSLIMSPLVLSGEDCRPRRTRRAGSAHSELHLGLGKFGAYDEAVIPGPSPPASPAASPLKRNFPPSAYAEKNKSRALPASPLPITAFRAPRKASNLLGSAYPAAASATKKRDHFRPLPSQVAVEIERFFGEVPRKSSRKPNGLKSPSADPRTRAGTRPSNAADTGEDRHVGEGKTVRHKAEDGSMWLDVEEEQEFAWLMAEALASLTAPLPNTQGVEILLEEKTDDEDLWGMKAFTSVLSLPRKGKGNAKNHHAVGESYFEIETPKPRRSGLRIIDDSPPWKTPMPSPPRFNGLSTPSASGKRSQLLPRSRDASSSRASDSESSSSSSPVSKRKARPPPLDLKLGMPKASFPTIVTSPLPPRPLLQQSSSEPLNPLRPTPKPTTSSARPNGVLNNGSSGPIIAYLSSGSKAVSTPSTPFVHPRTAPRPDMSVPATDISVPAVPSLPAQYASRDTEPAPISFFEPLTPIERTSGHGRTGSVEKIFGAGKGKAAKSSGTGSAERGGAWLRKMGKAVAGGVRI